MTNAQTHTLWQMVLKFLAIRNLAAFSHEQVANRLRVEGDVDFRFTDDDVKDACVVLIHKGFIQEVRESELDVVKHYEVTAKGIVESSRWREERGLS